jgi:hypothetical protein
VRPTAIYRSGKTGTPECEAAIRTDPVERTYRRSGGDDATLEPEPGHQINHTIAAALSIPERGRPHDRYSAVVFVSGQLRNVIQFIIFKIIIVDSS